MSKDIPPMCWAMCAGTNRGSLASDTGAGESADNGRFTSHIISEDCGLFEPNVSEDGDQTCVREGAACKGDKKTPPAGALDVAK